MPEQFVRHQEESDSDQQTYHRILKGEAHENNRHNCTGKIQCRD